VCSREARRAGRLRDREGAKDMATVVRETERKYDPAASGTATLDAARTMTGMAGVAAVSRQGELLGDHHDSVLARTVLLDLARKARAAGEETFTYGLMHQRQACQAATIEQALARYAAAPRDRATGH
jgi:hypothetical protein